MNIESKSLMLFEKAIPQYEVGHLKKVDEIESLSPNKLTILGNYMYGVSIINIVCKSREVVRNQFS